MLPDPKLLLQMLTNREQVIQSILADLSITAQNLAAFEKLENLYAEGKSVDSGKVLRACAKSIHHTHQVNQRMLLLLLVYAAGDRCASDMAHLLAKMGRGEDALREMMRQKMSGK